MPALIALLLAVACAPSASAVEPITESLNVTDGHCPLYGDMEICSGEVTSFDQQTELDVDLTKPLTSGSQPHPLIVMLHGFGGNKHNWESQTDQGDDRDKWRWNSHWFAKHGYYVLTYTARGHCPVVATCAARGDEPPTPPGSSHDELSGKAHLKSREIEVKDTQWLAALVADSFDVDSKRIAVSGGSYGGGESWMQASQPDWSFPARQTKEDSNPLPALQLQVAVPKYPWTDLAYSLAPNGRGGGPSGEDIYESATGTPVSGEESAGTPKANPVGAAKFSFIEGLFGSGLAGRVRFREKAPPVLSEECDYSTTEWHNRSTVQGDPYEIALPPPAPDCSDSHDDIVRQVRHGLTRVRSSYYQDEGWARQSEANAHKTAIFSISGWTDDLFPAVESFRQFKYLKRLDPLWPVAVAVADVGHQRAQNKPETWRRLNDQAWQFLESQINGSHREQTTVYSEPTICPGQPNLTAAQQLTASTPEELSRGELAIDYQRPGHLVNPLNAFDPEGVATDPVLSGSGCAESPEPAPVPDGAKYEAESQPLPYDALYVGLGYVEVPYQWAASAPPASPLETSTLTAKVYDVAPGAEPLLVTRGVYRLFGQAGYDPPQGTLKLPLFGNQWQLDPGHRVRIVLSTIDQPFLRAGNEPATIDFEHAVLHMPTRQSAQRALTGG